MDDKVVEPVISFLGLKDCRFFGEEEFLYDEFRKNCELNYNPVNIAKPYTENVAIVTERHDYTTTSLLAETLLKWDARLLQDTTSNCKITKLAGIKKIIFGFILKTAGTSHLLCGLVSSLHYSAFYDRSLAFYTSYLIYLDKKNDADVPYVMVLVEDDEALARCASEVGIFTMSSRVTRHAQVVQYRNNENASTGFEAQMQFDTWNVIDKDNLDKGCDIFIVKKEDVNGVVKKLIKMNPAFFRSLKRVIIEDTDRNTIDVLKSLKNVVNEEESFCSYLFLADATKKFRDFVPKMCRMLRKQVHIELEALKRFDVYKHIRLHRLKSTANSFMNVVHRCKVTESLVEHVECVNETRTRRVKLLIVTASDDSSLYLGCTLWQNNSNSILFMKCDNTVSEDEEVRYQYRVSEKSTLIACHNCVQKVDKGIVDNVILYQLPHVSILGAFLENEIPRLVSHRSIKLRLNIILDEDKDKDSARLIAKFLRKYHQAIPEYLRRMAIAK